MLFWVDGPFRAMNIDMAEHPSQPTQLFLLGRAAFQPKAGFAQSVLPEGPSTHARSTWPRPH